MLVITLAVVAAGAAMHPHNPLRIKEAFPWAWLAPLLVALRYGLLPGLASSLIFLATWEVQSYHSRAGFPSEYFLGGGALVLLAGEFGMGWAARLRRTEEANRYLRERLHRITQRHLLLKLSHDHMEQGMLTRPATLRSALNELRTLAAAHSGPPLAGADALLQLLAQYCQLESAALFVPAQKRTYRRVAAIGSPPDLDAKDPLLAHALEHQALSHVLGDAPCEGERPSRFLVMAPIIASDGALLGILAVEHMPFLALNEENLQMLLVLVGYYADCVVESEGVRQFLERFPAAPLDFAMEFSRMARLQRSEGIDSHLIVFPFENNEAGQRDLARHGAGRRSLDVAWQIDAGSKVLLANLMPLANAVAVREYLARIGSGPERQSPGGEGANSPFVISLAERDPAAVLADAIGSAASC